MKNDNPIKLFDQPQIRHHWDQNQKLWYFSIIDVIKVLTQTSNPSRYWKNLQAKLNREQSKVANQTKKVEIVNGNHKPQLVEVANTQSLLRIIQSISSPKAEPIKLWLAQVGLERILESDEPEKAFERAMDTYLHKGYNIKWVNQRLKSIDIRKELAGQWQDQGVKVEEFRILTDEITKAWSGKTTRQYKDHKGLSSQNLRDNMTSLELVLNMLGEMSTIQISKQENPEGLSKNKKVAKRGGTVAKKARLELEKQIGQSIVSSQNASHVNRL